jgi:hypothetical protein
MQLSTVIFFSFTLSYPISSFFFESINFRILFAHQLSTGSLDGKQQIERKLEGGEVGDARRDNKEIKYE